MIFLFLLLTGLSDPNHFVLLVSSPPLPEWITAHQGRGSSRWEGELWAAGIAAMQVPRGLSSTVAVLNWLSYTCGNEEHIENDAGFFTCISCGENTM